MTETSRDFFNSNEIVGRAYLFARPDSKSSPFVVRFKLKDGKYLKRCFKSHADRMQFIHEHRAGTEITSFNAGEWQAKVVIELLAACLAKHGSTDVSIVNSLRNERTVNFTGSYR